VRDGKDLRRLALALKVPIITTVAGARATALAIKGLRDKPLQHVSTARLLSYIHSVAEPTTACFPWQPSQFTPSLTCFALYASQLSTALQLRRGLHPSNSQ